MKSTVAALVVGLAATCALLSSLTNWFPVEAGLVPTAILILVWVALLVVAARKDGRRAWWAALPVLVILPASGIIVWILGACLEGPCF